MTGALFLLFGLLFEFTRAKSYSYDGLCYALDVEFAPATNWFHPYHLLYSALSRVLFAIAHMLAPSARALFTMQHVNAWVGAAAVALLYFVIAKRWGRTSGLFAAAIFGLSRAYWNEVIDPGCYAWAGLAAVVMLAVVLRHAESEVDEPFTLGLIVGVATLFHYMLFLAWPAFLIAGRRSSAVRGFAGAVLGAGVPYLAVIAMFHPSLAEAKSWFLGLALAPSSTHGMMWWRWTLVQNAIDAWTGSVASFVPSNYPAQLFFAFLFGFTVIWTLHRRSASQQRIPYALWAWVGLMLLFQSFYNPGATRFRILWMPAFLYLAAGALRPFWHHHWKAIAVGTVVTATLGALNFKSTIQPRLVTTTDDTRVRFLNGHLGSQDFFLFVGSEQSSILNVYMAYFGHDIPARSLYGYFFDHLDGNSAELTLLMREAMHRGNVWVEAPLLDPATQALDDGVLGVPPLTLEKTFAGLKAGETLTGSDGYKISRVIAQELLKKSLVR